MTTPTRTEARPHLRDAAPLLVGVLLLAAVLAALGAVPASRELASLFGGLRFTDYLAPPLLAIAIAASGLQTMPGPLANGASR